MPGTSYARWAAAFRRACDEAVQDYVSGPDWDNVVDILARTVDTGAITVEQAAKLNRALSGTLGQETACCEVCECPAASLRVHP